MTFFSTHQRMQTHNDNTTMTMLRHLLLVLLGVCCLSLAESTDDVSIQQSLVDWIRSQGGYFNPKQEFRRAVPGDATSPFGIFATETINEGEVLTSIPWKCVVTAGTDEFETSLHCDTTRLLIEEMKRVQADPTDSTWAPYISYLLQRPPVDIPSTFGIPARTLLDKMLQKNKLPPKYASQWIDDDWKKDCHGSMDDFDVQAAMLLLTRGDDDMLIPIYDLYNHRNGKWHNTKNNVVEDVKHEISASRTIQAGEEIYNSYNHCTNCYNRYMDFGTPEIYRDYGFVEQYPQRWIFKKQEIGFDVDVNPEGKLQLQWLDYPPFDKVFTVTQAGVDYLSDHLARLKKFYTKELQPLLKDGKAQQQGITKGEMESIMQYYNALTTALQMAVEAAKEYDYIVFDGDNDDDDEDEEIVLVKTKDTASSTKTDSVDDVSMKLDVVEWIRANGGTFNEKQEFRREKPGDPNSLFGIFATSDIKKGETLLSVPWKLVMTSGTDDVDDGLFFCGTADFIAKEMKLGDESKFAPYVRYLLDAPPVDIPSTWSQRAKNIFRVITGKGRLPPSYPVTWLEDFKTDCKKSGDDPIEVQAAMQLVTRGDDDTLTAVYDMYNHRNGKWFNAQSSLTYDVKHEVKAFRDIKKGHQIYISYNQCDNCFNRHFNFGTPEMLRDYGFVESYPQRWVFRKQEIGFDIVDDKNNGELSVVWLDGRLHKKFDKYFEVTGAGKSFLKAELRRLKGLNETLLQPLLVESAPESILAANELDTLLQFYNALTTALELAIESAKTYSYELSDAVEYDDDDDDDEEDMVPPKQAPPKKASDEYKWEENDDLDDDEEDADDDEGEDLDCPAGMVVKGRCVTNIRKSEEL